jgi:hypothetical protein
MTRETFGAYRAVVSDAPRAERVAAWAEAPGTLKTFETTRDSRHQPSYWSCGHQIHLRGAADDGR